LMRVAQIAADSETPFIAQGGSKILGIESVAEAPDAGDWHLSADATEAKLWTMLRDMPEASYLGLALPRLIARMPYGAKSEPTETFSFEEFDGVPEHESYIWMNPAFACALLLAQSFRAYGWEMQRMFQDIEDLPLHMYKADGENKIKPCAEIAMTQNGAEKILNQGLMPLISFRDTDRVRLGRFQSISSGSTALLGKWAS
jgi:type VI secretion system protein ImpC